MKFSKINRMGRELEKRGSIRIPSGKEGDGIGGLESDLKEERSKSEERES